MKMVRAQVADNADFLENGTIQVYAKDISQEILYVNYVSPYSAAHHGGIVAIPEVGVQVLICQPDGTDQEWYYMGSIFGANEGNDFSGNRSLDALSPGIPDREVYRARGKPQRLVISDATGNKLVLSNSYSPDYFNLKSALESALGKKIELNDSPKLDSIFIKNEHNDGIKITSSPQQSSAGRSIEAESRGPVKVISRESDIELLVVDGREIDIVNDSTGNNKDDSLPFRYGNINLRSLRNDINLTVDDEEGSIFITSKGGDGIVQIAANGTITVYGEGDVNIRAGSDLNLKADENINLDAGASINIKSAGAFSVDSGETADIRSGGDVNVDGSNVHLNSGRSGGVEGIEIDKTQNNYEE